MCLYFLVFMSFHAFTNSLHGVSKIINLYKLINKLTKSNKYEFCLSHMSSLMVIISSPILKMRKIKSIFWYTHKGPTDFLKKIFLLKASIYSNKIINRDIKRMVMTRHVCQRCVP